MKIFDVVIQNLKWIIPSLVILNIIYMRLFGGKKRLEEKMKRRTDDEVYAQKKNRQGLTNEFVNELLFNQTAYFENPSYMEFRRKDNKEILKILLLALFFVSTVLAILMTLFLEFDAILLGIYLVLSVPIFLNLRKVTKYKYSEEHNKLILRLQEEYYQNKNETGSVSLTVNEN